MLLEIEYFLNFYEKWTLRVHTPVTQQFSIAAETQACIGKWANLCRLELEADRTTKQHSDFGS
jgi:hypothetical protein